MLQFYHAFITHVRLGVSVVVPARILNKMHTQYIQLYLQFHYWIKSSQNDEKMTTSQPLRSPHNGPISFPNKISSHSCTFYFHSHPDLSILEADLVVLPQSIMKVQSADKRKPLTRGSLFQSNRINIPLLCKQLAYETPLELPLLKEIIDRFKHVIDAEPNLLHVEDPALVIGDIHGQFYDLVKILSHANAIRGERQLNCRLVFLGDYVDRGINAVEVTILLMCLKIEYPTNIYLLRGNHESRIMTAQYNFRSECCLKYSQEVYELMMDAFDLLPLACVVNHSYFCVHGGISDKMLDINKINTLARKMEIPVESSAFCDFIWSDPIDNERGVLPSKTVYNESRDCSVVFGAELVAEFLALNDLSTIIRGHEVFLEGFRTYDWGKVKPTPSVLTIFSAPNYCGVSGNKAAVLKIENNAFRIKQFREQQPQKYKFLVKFDVFSWTLPEMMKNVREIVLEMMDSIVETHLPELKDIDSERRLKLFVDFAVKQHLVEPVLTQSEVIRQHHLTVEQERNYLFNRSHEYYAEFQKLPKHH